MTRSVEDIISEYPLIFFSKEECPFCDKLEADLLSIGLGAYYKKVMLESDLREELIELTKCKTVPQLFIGGKFVGGYKEFSILCGTGGIEKLLKPLGIEANLDF